MFINNIDELANLLHIKPKTITYSVYKLKIQNNYESFSIPKKNGGERQIFAPKKNLLIFQKHIYNLLVKRQEQISKENKITNKICHGFQRKKSIITNANPHKNKKYILNIDIENFFDSFHIGRVYGYFIKNKFFEMEHKVASIISTICCYKNKLPQGAPTSPLIANLIFQTVDFRIIQLCKKYKLTYTRYADDLTFSTNKKDFYTESTKFLNELSLLIENAGFHINNKKTHIQDSNHRQTVTGLIVNKKINTKRKFFKETKAAALSLYKNGACFLDNKKANANQINGRFSFINQIDSYNPHKLDTQNKIIYNSREKCYRLFLFYKTFLCNTAPIIMTEGKTDILYLKAALMSKYKDYPKLVSKDKKNNFKFRINFFRRTKLRNFMFKISPDGGCDLTAVYNMYKSSDLYDKFVKYDNDGTGNIISKFPFILIYDNEQRGKKKPLHILLNNNNITEKEKSNIIDFYFTKISNSTNLYATTIPLPNGLEECEIEDLLPENILNMEINGKKFNKGGGKDFFGKDILSKYIYNHYSEIDFSNFDILLDNINKIVSNFNEMHIEKSEK